MALSLAIAITHVFQGAEKGCEGKEIRLGGQQAQEHELGWIGLDLVLDDLAGKVDREDPRQEDQYQQNHEAEAAEVIR